AAADLPAIEASSPHALHLDVEGLLAHARRIAQHVHQRGLWGGLAEGPVVPARLLVALDRPLAELPRGESAGGDDREVAHPWPQPARHVGRDRGPEREAREAKGRLARRGLEE